MHSGVCIPSAASGLLLGAIIYKIDPEFPGWVVASLELVGMD